MNSHKIFRTKLFIALLLLSSTANADQQAIQDAIDAAPEGGTVVLPEGETELHRVVDSVWCLVLKSDITLEGPAYDVGSSSLMPTAERTQ